MKVTMRNSLSSLQGWIIYGKAINGFFVCKNGHIDLSLSLGPVASKDDGNPILPSSTNEHSLKLSLATTSHPYDVANNFGKGSRTGQESPSYNTSDREQIQSSNQHSSSALSLATGSKRVPFNKKGCIKFCGKYMSSDSLVDQNVATIPLDTVDSRSEEHIHTEGFELLGKKEKIGNGRFSTKKDKYSWLRRKNRSIHYSLDNFPTINIGREGFSTLNIP